MAIVCFSGCEISRVAITKNIEFEANEKRTIGVDHAFVNKTYALLTASA